MRLISILAIVTAFALSAPPAHANAPLDFIINEQSEWASVCADLGQTLVDTHIGVTCNNPRVVTYDLAPGSYHVYASGGMFSRRLDLSASGENGRAFGDDYDATPYAAMSFVLFEREKVTLTVMPYMDATIFSTDYYCLVVACEGDGGMFGSSFEPQPIEPPEVAEGEEGGEPVEVEMEVDLAPSDPDEWATALRDLRSGWIDTVTASETWRLSRHDIFPVTDTANKTFNYYYTEDWTAVLKVAVDGRCESLEVKVTSPNGEVLTTEPITPATEFECIFPIMSTENYSFDFTVLGFADDFAETYVTYLVYIIPPAVEE